MSREHLDFGKAVEEAKRSGYFREQRENISGAIKEALSMQYDGSLDADLTLPSKMNIDDMYHKDGRKKNHIDDK